MFLAEIEPNALRQGDILQDVLLLGAINYNSITFSTNDKNEKKAVLINTEPKYGYAMVLSHSCELDPENGIKVTSIILSPLRHIDKATSHEKYSELSSTNEIEENGQRSFLKYFLIPPFGEFSNGAVVDFSKCFSYRNQSYQHLLSKKVFQLDKETVDKMALKLGLYFFRPSPE